MSRAKSPMLEFARRLIAYETRGNKVSGINPPAPFLIYEKFRPHLATLIGEAGFRSLMLRALALAQAEVPWMRGVGVNADGSLEGLDELEAKLNKDEVLEGRVVLLSQLLGLLMAFIGESLTLRLVREVWPKVSLHDLDFGKGDKNEKTK
jgi:hypothetical protein